MHDPRSQIGLVAATGARNAKRLLLLVALVAAAMPAALTAGSKTMAGTLSMNATLALTHGAEGPFGDISCQQADECAGRHVSGPFRGLGRVDGRYDYPMNSCGGGEARPLRYPIRLTVAGKGEIQVAVAEGPCVPFVPNSAQSFTVTGGTGSYAGASGSGTIVASLSMGNPPRYGTETWTGTFEVPGLEFDVTRPTLTGASNKTVKARKGAKSARVAFRVTAQDDRDGALPVTCSPRSGYAFPIGRNRVTCYASDSSANEAQASFTVTVQRRR
jgi:hypothetical protein